MVVIDTVTTDRAFKMESAVTEDVATMIAKILNDQNGVILLPAVKSE